MKKFNLLRKLRVITSTMCHLRLAIVIFTFSLSTSNTFSQEGTKQVSKIDSLKNQLQYAQNDSLRAELLYQIIISYDNIQYQTQLEGQFALAYEACRNIFDLFNNQENQNIIKKLDSQYQKKFGFWYSNTLFNYGRLMGEMENRNEQKDHFEKSYQLAKKWNDTTNQVFTLVGTAFFIHQNENKLDLAQNYLERAFEFPISNISYYFFVYYMAGDVKLNMGEYDLSKKLFYKGIDNGVPGNITPEMGLAVNYLGLSKVYRKLSNYDSSYYYGIKSLQILKTIKEVKTLKVNLSHGYENLFEHFQQVGKLDSAFYYLKLANQESTFFHDKKIKELVAFQEYFLKREILLKDLQREKVETESRTRTYAISGILMVVLILGSVLLFNYRQKQKANKDLQSTLSHLKSTQSQLIQAEKMASLGELTAGIAHEIQNPLNFVNNFSEVSSEMLDEMDDELDNGDIKEAKAISADLKQNLEKIHHHGNRASSIVKGMLEHSRTSSGKKELTDINALADEYLRLAYHGLRAKDKNFNAEMVTDFDTKLPKIEVIPQDIGRVLLNLINNAFQATSEEALKRKSNSDENEAKSDSYKPKVSITTSQELTANSQKRIAIKIKDNGPGIPEEIKDKIFQPFFTTKDTGKGTGLGLSLAYDIVKAHGGEIEVESKENEGASFTFKLPKS